MVMVSPCGRSEVWVLSFRWVAVAVAVGDVVAAVVGALDAVVAVVADDTAGLVVAVVAIFPAVAAVVAGVVAGLVVVVVATFPAVVVVVAEIPVVAGSAVVVAGVDSPAVADLER